MGYIYLLQPAELVGTDRYKIGISSKGNLNRLRSYGNGTRYMFFIECDDFFRIENRLKKAFNDCKDIKCIKGKEYFQGDQEVILKIFFKIVYDDKIKDLIGSDAENKVCSNKYIEKELDVEMEDVSTLENNKEFVSSLQKFKFK